MLLRQNMFEGDSIGSRETAALAQPEAAGPDNRVTPTRTWLIRAAIVLSTAALLGTSQEPEPGGSEFDGPDASLIKTVQGPELELTAENPRAQFLVKVTADDLGPGMVVTTTDTVGSVNGNVGGTGAMGEVPQVSIKLADGDPEGGHEEILAGNGDFGVTHRLLFKGSCEQPTAGDCSAVFGVELSRSDEGANGGSLRVTWAVGFNARIPTRSDGSAGSSNTGELVLGEPPWTVDITQL